MNIEILHSINEREAFKCEWQEFYDQSLDASPYLCCDWISTFFIEVSKKLALRGMLDLSVLYADKKPVSCIWGAMCWPYSTILNLGFDRTIGEYSPGTVHLLYLINDSVRHKWEAIEFGHEFYDYKSRWSKDYIELQNVYYFPNRFIPMMLRTGLVLKRTLRGN